MPWWGQTVNCYVWLEPGPDRVSYPSGSRVSQLLERISEVVEQNRLFTSDRPGLGQDLETLQQHLESLSAAPLPPDYGFNSSQGLTRFSFTLTNNKLHSLTSRTGFLLLEQVRVFSQSSALRTMLTPPTDYPLGVFIAHWDVYNSYTFFTQGSKIRLSLLKKVLAALFTKSLTDKKLNNWGEAHIV